MRCSKPSKLRAPCGRARTRTWDLVFIRDARLPTAPHALFIVALYQILAHKSTPHIKFMYGVKKNKKPHKGFRYLILKHWFFRVVPDRYLRLSINTLKLKIEFSIFNNNRHFFLNVMLHAQLPLGVPCYNFFHLTEPGLGREKRRLWPFPARLK